MIKFSLLYFHTIHTRETRQDRRGKKRSEVWVGEKYYARLQSFRGLDETTTTAKRKENLCTILILIVWRWHRWRIICCCGDCHGVGEKITSWKLFHRRTAYDVIGLLRWLWRRRLFCQRVLIAKLLESKLILTFPLCSAVLVPSIGRKRRWWVSNNSWKVTHSRSHHVLTCVSDRLNWLATSPRSATDKYFWHRNFLSRNASCEWVNAVRRRRLRFIGIFDEPKSDLKACCWSDWGWWMLV